MFRNFSYGDKLVVQLSNTDVIYGDYVKGTGNRLDLKNLKDNEGRQIDGVLSFYTNEVVSVRVLQKKSNTTTTTHEEPTVNEHASKITSKNSTNAILIDEDEYDRLKQMVQDCTFIHQKDNLYYKACEDLQSAESIGVVGLGCKSGRDSKLSLLVLSTWQTVYIFDIFESFNRSLHELKEILESKYIQKVIHDGRAFIDCLTHVYGINIENVFDTLIADVTMKKRMEGKYEGPLRNISECLIDFFNFPEYLLHGAMTVNDSDWKQRPLDHELKIKAAQLGAYLLTMKDYLEKKLLEDYHNSVKSVYRIVTSSDTVGFSQYMSCDTFTPELDAVIKF